MRSTIAILLLASLAAMSACLLLEAEFGVKANVSCHNGNKSSDHKSDESMQQCCQKGLFTKEVKPAFSIMAAFNCLLPDISQKFHVQFLPIESSGLDSDSGQHLAKLSVLRI